MKAILLFSFLFLSLQVGHSAEPKEEWAPRPMVMSLFVGGRGPSYEVTYDRRVLRYYEADDQAELKGAKPVVVTPTEEQWKAFHDELNRLKAWDWKRKYVNKEMFDGTKWSACIVYSSSEALVTVGSNSGPEEIGAFLEAVRKLIGGRKFQ